MFETVYLALAGLTVLLIGAFLYWVLRLQISIGRGERTRVKRRDLDTRRKTFTYALLAYLALPVYLSIASFESLIGTENLPLNGIPTEVTLLMEGVGFIGLAYLLYFMNPLKKLPTQTS